MGNFAAEWLFIAVRDGRSPARIVVWIIIITRSGTTCVVLVRGEYRAYLSAHHHYYYYYHPYHRSSCSQSREQNWVLWFLLDASKTRTVARPLESSDCVQHEVGVEASARRSLRRGDVVRENPGATRRLRACCAVPHGEMACRVVSSRAAPSSSSRFSSSRFMFIFTLSLSFTYVCYSVLFCSAPVMPSSRFEERRCARGESAGAKSACAEPNSSRSELGATASPRRAALNRSEQAGARGPRARGEKSKPGNASSLGASAQRFGNKKLPNALIVGVKKGGTRAVLEFIRIHPDVRALGTEPHFFDRNYDKGMDWYR